MVRERDLSTSWRADSVGCSQKEYNRKIRASSGLDEGMDSLAHGGHQIQHVLSMCVDSAY